MSWVVSIYCTLHRVNCTSFSRQKGETAPIHMPLCFKTQTDCIYFKNCLQHNTKQLVFEAVTRCKMHCQKNPWKIPHWGNVFYFIHFFFHFVFSAATSLPLSLTLVFPSESHSYWDVATSLRTQKRPFLWSGKFTNGEKTWFLFHCYKDTNKKQKKAAWNQPF